MEAELYDPVVLRSFRSLGIEKLGLHEGGKRAQWFAATGGTTDIEQSCTPADDGASEVKGLLGALAGSVGNVSNVTGKNRRVKNTLLKKWQVVDETRDVPPGDPAVPEDGTGVDMVSLGENASSHCPVVVVLGIAARDVTDPSVPVVSDVPAVPTVERCPPAVDDELKDSPQIFRCSEELGRRDDERKSTWDNVRAALELDAWRSERVTKQQGQALTGSVHAGGHREAHKIPHNMREPQRGRTQQKK